MWLKVSLSRALPQRRWMNDVKDLVITGSASVRNAFEQLQRTGQGLLLLVDATGRLVRTVTDGDLRRLILSGQDLSAALDLLPQKRPVVLPDGIDDMEALGAMGRSEVDEVPVLDTAGRPVRVLFRRDLDTRILLSTPH